MQRLITYSDGALHFIDQTLLPAEYRVDAYTDYREVCTAIKQLKVRGAPAIGVAAGYAAVVAANQFLHLPADQFRSQLALALDELASTRPTAVNLFFALDRMREVAASLPDAPNSTVRDRLLDAAEALAEEDFTLGRKLGEVGSSILDDGDAVMTICNAGALATAGIGSALSCVYLAKEAGKNIRVFALETRPLLQGARLTTWELMRENVDVTLVTDGMAALVLKTKGITKVITGADRIALNGDSANKIGTYGLAVLAHHHGVPFYIAAPKSTFDFKSETGASIPIEERDPDEVRNFHGTQTAPADVKVFNPAFDVTPADLISGIITEEGILRPPFRDNIRALWG